MAHSSHRNYKIWVINPSETNKTAENGVLRLCLKPKTQGKFQWNLPAG